MAMKETFDCLDLVDALAKAKIEAMKDGVVDWRDTPKFAPVIVAAISAFRGSDKIKEEVSEMSKEDMEALISRAMETIELCKKAILA